VPTRDNLPLAEQGVRISEPCGQTSTQPSGAPRMSSTQEAIYDIIAKTCNLDRSKITPASTLKDLDVHSLDAVQVLFEIEDRFDISVPEREDQYSAGTVQDLIDGVENLLAAKGTTGTSSLGAKASAATSEATS
jgi:acyl carrier protein